MSNKRIDLTQNGGRISVDMCKSGFCGDLIAELKRCYEMIDQARANLEELYEVTESGEVQSIARSLSQEDMEHTVICAACIHKYCVPTPMLNRLMEGEKIIVKGQVLFSTNCPKCSLDIIDA